MIVTPASRSDRTTAHISLRKATSTPAVGSSKNRIDGSCDSAFAINTRRFMPPDNVMILLSFLSHSDSSRSTFSICAGLAALPNSPRLKLTVFQTVSNMSVDNSCGTSPIIDRTARNSAAISRPSTRTSPPLRFTIPHTILMSVVFPAPFGPSSAKISPRAISRSTLFRA